MKKSRATLTSVVVALSTTWPGIGQELKTARPQPEMLERGAPQTIQVTIGGNVRSPGPRVLPTGFGLKSVLGIVGGYSQVESGREVAGAKMQFTGTIKIYRYDPEKEYNYRMIEYSIAELQMAKTLDVELVERDVIDIEFLDSDMEAIKKQEQNKEQK